MSLFTRVRALLFGSNTNSPRPRDRNASVPSINAVRGRSNTSHFNIPPQRTSSIDSNSRFSGPSFGAPPESQERQDRHDRLQQFGNKEIVKLLRKTTQSCQNLMRENQRLKDEIANKCNHVPGVHYLHDPNVRASDIHRMNRARSAFFAPLSSEIICVHRGDRDSYNAAQKKMRELARASNFDLDVTQDKSQRSVSVERKATQTEAIREEEKQEPSSDDRSIKEQRELFGNEERVIHSVSSQIKKAVVKQVQSPYVRCFPKGKNRDSEERVQRDVVHAYEFSSSEGELLPEPHTEPREANQNRYQNLLLTGDTSATRKLLDSEQGDRFQSDERHESPARPQVEQNDVIVIPSSSEGSQQPADEQLFLPEVQPQQRRQESELSHRPQDFNVDYNFLSRRGSERPPSQGTSAVVIQEVVEVHSQPKVGSGFATFARRPDVDNSIRITFEEAAAAPPSREMNHDGNLLDSSNLAEYGGSRGHSSAKESHAEIKEEYSIHEKEEEDKQQQEGSDGQLQEADLGERVQLSLEEPEKEVKEKKPEKKEESYEYMLESQSEEEEEEHSLEEISHKEEVKQEEELKEEEEPERTSQRAEENRSAFNNYGPSSAIYGESSDEDYLPDESQEQDDEEMSPEESEQLEDSQLQEVQEAEFIGNEMRDEGSEELKEVNVEEEKELIQDDTEEFEVNQEVAPVNQVSGFESEEVNIEVSRSRFEGSTQAVRRGSRSGRQSSSSKRSSHHIKPTPESRLHGRGPPRNPSPPPTRGYELRSKFGLARVNYLKFLKPPRYSSGG